MQASAFRVVFAAAIAGFTVVMAGPPPHAQSMRPPTTADFEKWESLAPQARALSPDGAWLAYGITRSNRENELRIVNVGTAATAVAAFGDQPAFSADSRWLAYGIAISETEEASLRKAKKPLHRSLGLRDLRGGTFVVLPGVESFSFSHSGMFVAFKRYSAETPAGQEASPQDEDAPKPGADLVVRNLQTGRDTAFGNVSEFAWQGNARSPGVRGQRRWQDRKRRAPVRSHVRQLARARLGTVRLSRVVMAEGRGRPGGSAIEDGPGPRRVGAGRAGVDGARRG